MMLRVGLALQIHPWHPIRQGFHIQTTQYLSRRIQCRRRVRGATWHMQLKFYHRSTIWLLTTTTTMCCGGIGTSDPPLGTIRQGFHIQATPVPGMQTSVADGSGPLRHMQLKFYRSTSSAATTMCCGGIGTSDPPSGTIRQGFHTKLPTPSVGTQTSVADVVSHHAVRGSYRSNCSATTTMCCGGIGTSDPPSTIRQDFHIQPPTLSPRDAVLQTWFGANPAHAAQPPTGSNCSATTTTTTM
jgi:hypothetical protein